MRVAHLVVSNAHAIRANHPECKPTTTRGGTGRINMPNPIIKTEKSDKEDERDDSQAPVD